MKSLNIREMRAALPRLDEIIRQEGELLVTCRGRTLARVLPAKSAAGMPSHAGLRERMQPFKVPSEVLIREDRDRG